VDTVGEVNRRLGFGSFYASIEIYLRRRFAGLFFARKLWSSLRVRESDLNFAAASSACATPSRREITSDISLYSSSVVLFRAIRSNGPPLTTFTALIPRNVDWRNADAGSCRPHQQIQRPDELTLQADGVTFSSSESLIPQSSDGPAILR